MVTIYGMSGKLPNISLKKTHQNDLLGRDSPLNKRSEQLEQKVDDEVIRIISTCYDDVIKLVKKHQHKLNDLAGELLEKEVLQKEDVARILN
jgi:cell division protease FtsH